AWPRVLHWRRGDGCGRADYFLWHPGRGGHGSADARRLWRRRSIAGATRTVTAMAGARRNHLPRRTGGARRDEGTDAKRCGHTGTAGRLERGHSTRGTEHHADALAAA